MQEHVLIKHEESNQERLPVLSAWYLAVIRKELVANALSFLQAEPI